MKELKKLTNKEIHQIIEEYPTLHVEGFTGKDIMSLAETWGMDLKKLNEAIGVNTCIMIEGSIITFHCDVETGFSMVAQDRDMYPWEFD